MITLVGSPFSAVTNNNTDVTLTFPGGMQQDDVLFVFGSHGTRVGGNNGPVSTIGWSQQFLYLGSVNEADLDMGLWTRVQGATPITSADFEASGNSRDAVAFVGFCLRGVDTSNPSEVESLVIDGTDPPAITTLSNNSWVIAVGSTRSTDTAVDPPIGYSNVILASGSDTIDCSLVAATKEVAVAGSEDPSDYTTLGGTSAKKVVTIAVKPAATGGAAQDIVLQSITTTSTLFTPQLSQRVDLPLITTVATLFNPTVSQDIKVAVIVTTSNVFNPRVAEEIDLPVLATTSTLFSPTLNQDIDVPLLNTPSTIHSPSIPSADAQVAEVPFLETVTTLFAPTTSYDVEVPVLNTLTTLFEPSLDYIVKLPLLETSSNVFSPSTSYNVQVPLLALAPTVYPPLVGDPPVGGTLQGFILKQGYPNFPSGIN